jgi:hypothetical protein
MIVSPYLPEGEGRNQGTLFPVALDDLSAGLVSAIGSLTRNSVRPGCDSKSMAPSL